MFSLGWFQKKDKNVDPKVEENIMLKKKMEKLKKEIMKYKNENLKISEELKTKTQEIENGRIEFEERVKEYEDNIQTIKKKAFDDSIESTKRIERQEQKLAGMAIQLGNKEFVKKIWTDFEVKRCWEECRSCFTSFCKKAGLVFKNESYLDYLKKSISKIIVISVDFWEENILLPATDYSNKSSDILNPFFSVSNGKEFLSSIIHDFLPSQIEIMDMDKENPQSLMKLFGKEDEEETDDLVLEKKILVKKMIVLCLVIKMWDINGSFFVGKDTKNMDEMKFEVDKVLCGRKLKKEKHFSKYLFVSFPGISTGNEVVIQRAEVVV